MHKFIDNIVAFSLKNKFFIFFCTAIAVIAGAVSFKHTPIDAFPDVTNTKVTIITQWPGRSAEEVEKFITIPVEIAMNPVQKKTDIRSTTLFGLSVINVMFEDRVDDFTARQQVYNLLNDADLPDGVTPEVQPLYGPTGEIFRYTLRSDKRSVRELKTIQDWVIERNLRSVSGVADIVSFGGEVKTFEVSVNPHQLINYGITSLELYDAIAKSNINVGGDVITKSSQAYVVRGIGLINDLDELRNIVVKNINGTPILVKNLADVHESCLPRLGQVGRMDEDDVVQGIVVMRKGENPGEVIANLKDKIEDLNQNVLPKDVKIVAFYDREDLVNLAVKTVTHNLIEGILLVTFIVLIFMADWRTTVIVAVVIPLALLFAFICLRVMGMSANLLSMGAIDFGIIIDGAVVMVEGVFVALDKKAREVGMPAFNVMSKMGLIRNTAKDKAKAVFFSKLIIITALIPIFSFQKVEGKMFSPLAYTKTYALASAFVLGLILLPTLSYILFSVRIDSKRIRKVLNYILIAAGVLLSVLYSNIPALGLTAVGLNNLLAHRWKKPGISNYINIGIALVVATYFLAEEWLPMGPQKGIIVNLLFVTGCIAIILALLWLLVIYYERILRWCLNNRWKFMLLPIATILCGILIWKRIGQEFMPSLNEGSFLLMPTSMPHTGIEQNLNYIEALDKRLAAIPEVETAIGKWGRVNSALDPAPAQMFENTINYRPEYILNEDGKRERFKVNRKGEYLLRNGGTYNPADGFRLIPADSLIPDRKGDYFRQWRPEIKNTDDIWQQIVNVTHLPGLTSAPKLQPIEARLVMLSTGMRAPMGLKIYGPDLETIEQSGKAIEQALKDVPSVIPSSVFYDRAVGAPYLEIKLNRDNMARYGVNVEDLQEILSAAVGGMILTKTIEGRERFPVRLRYARELRDNPEALSMLLVPTATGAQIPLKELADIEYARGAQMIQSENTFLVGYVIFDKKQGKAEVDVVKEATKVIEGKIQNGELKLTKGVSYKFAGNYEQQERATARLMIVVPLALLIVLLVLYFQFKTLTASLIHFSGVFVAFAGGFILLWLYGQDWFMNFSLAGVNMRDLFQMHTINLSVAVWVGFIALFGVATDDGVLMGTYIHHVFLEKDPQTRHAIREAVVTAGLKRVRPAAMTTATTLIALLPVLTSTGKGADIMVPMAIPTFGGMLIQSMTMFVVPVFQCWWREGLLKKEEKARNAAENSSPGK